MKLGSEILYLSRADIQACEVPLADVEASVEAMFAAKAKGTALMKPKLALHSEGSWFLAMVGGIADKGYTGMKWVGVTSTQEHGNQPHINGHIVLNDFTTGMPVAVMDAQWITGVRTAAISATDTVASAAAMRSRICQSGSRMLHLLYCSQPLFSVEHAVTVNGPSIA